MGDKELIDKLLNDKNFQDTVENDTGFVKHVKINWKTDEIIFYGSYKNHKLKISETLEVLKNER